MKKHIPILMLALMTLLFAVTRTPMAPLKEEAMETENNEAYEDDMDKAMAQEVEMTKDPRLGYVPKERLLLAQQAAAQIMSSRQTLVQSQALTWTERGPNNVGGRTRAIIIDKRDATGNTVFAASVGGGIWKCTGFKSGPNWTKVDDKMGNLAVCSMAQDPTTPTIMYAGTGEGWFNSDAIRGNGIYKSTDGGATWNQLASTDVSVRKDFENVNDLIVTSNGAVYAACRSSSFCNNGGVLKSTDGGNTWTRVIGTFMTGGTCTDALNFRGADLEIAANGDLYATTGYNSTANQNFGRIWKSAITNGANTGNVGTWVDISPTPTTGNWLRIDLACAPGNAQKLVALFAGSDNAIKSIQRSEDGGTTWNVISNPNWCDQGSTKTDFTRGQAWYDLIVSIDPNNDGVFAIGGVDMLKTSNNGISFSQITQWANGCSGLPYVHADIHNITYYPGSSTEMIAGTDGGVFYSSDGGVTWSDRNVGYNVTQYYAMALHPLAGSNYMLAGAQDNGTQRFQDPGVNTTINVLGGDGAFCFIDQDNPAVQMGAFTSTNYRVTRSAWGGGLLGTSNGSGRFINPTEYDNDMGVLFHATDAGNLGVIKNIESGTLTPSKTFISELLSTQISALKVDPNVPKRIFIAGSGSGLPVVLRVDNDTAATPTVSALSSSSFPSGGYISSIDVEPGNSAHLLVTLSNYGVNSVWESTDGGTSWTSIEGNLPDMPVRWGLFIPDGLTFSTNGVSGIALATELGVWTTTNINGASTVWVPNNNGFANVRVDMIKFRANDRTLGAATHGRGLFTTILGTATSVTTIQNNKQFIASVFPTVASTQVNYTTGSIPGVRQMTLQLTDMNGRQLMQQNLAFRGGQLSIAALPAGTYLLKMTSDNKKYVHLQKIVKQW